MAYNLLYANKGSIRNMPVMQKLAQIYEQAANKAGIDAVRVVSGGQEATGSHRTGSHRHDLGGAGDIQLLKGGRALDFTNKDDLPVIENFLRESSGLGARGVGAGTDYMGNTTFHVGFGSPSVWGAGGRSANAPQWLRDTIAGAPGITLNTPLGAGLSAPAASAAPAAPADQLAAATKMMQQGFGGGSANTESAAPSQSVGAPISAGGSGGSGEELSAGASALMTELLNNRRKRYGVSLMGSPLGQ